MIDTGLRVGDCDGGSSAVFKGVDLDPVVRLRVSEGAGQQAVYGQEETMALFPSAGRCG